LYHNKIISFSAKGRVFQEKQFVCEFLWGAGEVPVLVKSISVALNIDPGKLRLCTLAE
jgi:hypothetical protein